MKEKFWRIVGIGILIIVFLWLVEWATPSFSVFSGLRTTLLLPLRGVVQVFSHLSLGFSRFSDLWRYSQLRRENLTLKEEVLRLRQRVEELEQELSRFQNLKESTRRVPEERLQPAKVAGYFTEGGRSYFLLKAGKAEGLKEGDPVVWGKYMVGKITEAYPHFSVADTLLSQKLIVNVYLKGTPENKGVVEGYLGTGMRLQIVPTREVKENALVLTSGLGGVFPPHFLVGRVLKRLPPPQEVNQKFLVEPLLDFGQLEEVFVIL
ncbi:rod shape-determining protein MreC [bacterium]|nr:rod shape-determining protein MreC [bacterium]